MTKTLLAFMCVASLALAGVVRAAPFTYQGQLSDNNSLPTNTYDFEFVLYDAASNGNMVGTAQTVDDVPVTDGIFQVELDFGNVFDGNDYWLEVQVRPGNSTGSYITLAPRQYMNFAPNAQYALAASDGPFWKLGGNTGAGSFLGTTDSNALEMRVNNQQVGVITHAELVVGGNSYHAPNVLLGSELNTIDPAVNGATVSGGLENTANGLRTTVGGGYYNTASATSATVGGGTANTANGGYSTIGGGSSNTTSYNYSTVGGGSGNSASNNASTVGGGSKNTASGNGSTVSGGLQNSASGDYSMVPGGSSNQAGGYYSFAAGRRAKVRDAATVGGGDTDGDEGTFVWADSTFTDFISTGPNQFLVRASGGIWFGTTSSPSISAGQFIATSTGAYLADGGTWTNSSDRNRKTNFQPIDPQVVLEKVVSLPILRWNYKEEDEHTLHLGPMAQDFHAAFGLGADDKHIATVDADGVALAAIQALAQENRDLRATVSDQQQQLALLLVDREAQQQQLATMEAHYSQQLAQLQQAVEALQANQQQLLSRLRQAEGEANTQEPAQ